jgi:hypothetical protein
MHERHADLLICSPFITEKQQSQEEWKCSGKNSAISMTSPIPPNSNYETNIALNIPT